MNKTISEWMAEQGRKGGLSKSEKKREAARKNIAKAQTVKLRRLRNGEA